MAFFGRGGDENFREMNGVRVNMCVMIGRERETRPGTKAKYKVKRNKKFQKTQNIYLY